MYNEKIKDNATKNDDKRKILHGIVEVVCVGDNQEENRNCLVNIMSHWVVLLSQTKVRLEQSEEVKIN